MTFDLNQNNLIDFLNKNNFNPIFQKETQQIYIARKINDLDILLFLIIGKENQLLQTIAYLPYQVHSGTTGDLARVLHLLNKELDMPGFGMDEDQKLLFFRAVIPCMEGKIDSTLLKIYLNTSFFAVETFMSAISMIASGSLKADEMIKNQKFGSHG